MSDTESSFTKEVYEAGGHLLSMRDLLHSFVDPENQLDGMARVSDMHFKVGMPVRYRFDGELENIDGGARLTKDVFENLIYPMLSPAQIERFEQSPPHDIDAGFEFNEQDASFRINVFHDRHGPAAVLRILPKQVPTVTSIGFPREQVWKDIVNLKQGLVLLTGITGSGKTTTLASLINQINQERKVRIITLEDPIEYFIDSKKALISQRQIGVHVDSFDNGLRSALREDPDIIFVGEMRDLETAALALSAAETGHLVMTTLHTKDAVGAINRFVGMFPPERSKEVYGQLSFAMSYVIGQKLLPRSSGQGRICAMEVMRNIGSIANLIRTGKFAQLYSVMETQSRVGMTTLEQRLMEMVQQGLVTKEEALRHANDISMLENI